MSEINLSSLAELEAASAVTVRVHTVPQSVPAAHFQLVAKRNSTTANPVPECNRLRVVNVPEQFLLLPADSTRSKFHTLLQSTLLDLAADVFKAWTADNMTASEFDPRRVTVDAVLKFWATEKESQRISAETITEWLKTCDTLTGFSAAKRDAWTRRLPKFASTQYRGNFSRSDAESIAAQITDADASHPVAVFILNRCGIIINAEETSEAL